MSEHSMAEAKLLKTTANLKSAIEDADIEALFVEDAYACILRGMMDQINCIVETVFQQVEEMVSSARASVCEWQQEQDFKAEIEAPVTRNCIWSIEEKNGDRFYGNKNLNWHGRMEEISSLREELDTISKSLSVSDIGHLSYGYLEVDEGSNNYKKGDRSHPKFLNNLKSSPSLSLISSSNSTSTSSSLWEVDVNRLTHMSTDELKSHLTKLKRSHESEVLDLTEQIYSLRRDFFKERGSSLPSKKSEEFDMLRRRISEVITKLDEVLVEKEEVATCGNNEESLSSLKDRLELLISENRHLREAMKDAEQNLNNLNMKCREENELRVLLEMEKLEKEKQCEEKERLAHDATAALENERERYELVAQELHNFKGETCRILKLISDSIEESKTTKQHLVDALEQNERYKADVCKLDQRLELAMNELCQERRRYYSF